MSEKIIEVENYSFQYNDTKSRALKRLNFSVNSGSFVSIIGRNGSGKSSLCNALVGLIPHYFVGKYAGNITVKGHPVNESSVAELSNTIGLVFQNPFNQLSYTADTVAEELAFGLTNRGVPREEMQRRVKEVADLMGITNLLEKNPLELSGGQVQRVAFGSAFIMNPEILVLDECTTQLDPLGAEGLIQITKELNSSGVTVIMVDHDMERVARYSDHVLVLNNAELVAQGTPEEIFTRNDLEELGIEPPAFLDISQILSDEKLVSPRITLTEEPTVALVREAL